MPLTAQEEVARELARDIVVAWLSNTAVPPGNLEQNPEKVGQFIGRVYKDILTAIVEGETIARREVRSA
jgi:hypothetical protein